MTACSLSSALPSTQQGQSAGAPYKTYWQTAYLGTTHALRFNGLNDYVQWIGPGNSNLLSSRTGYCRVVEIVFRAYPLAPGADPVAGFSPVRCCAPAAQHLMRGQVLQLLALASSSAAQLSAAEARGCRSPTRKAP